MNMNSELSKQREGMAIATLAVAYTFLAQASYDSWRHEGSPAEMAVYVVMEAKKRGTMGFLTEILLDHGHEFRYA